MATALKSTALPHAENLGRRAKPAAGFSLPAEVPALPIVAPGALLNAEQEVDLGFRIMFGQIGIVEAISADTDIVEMLVESISEAIESNETVDKAVMVAKVAGQWIRANSVPDADFKAVVRHKIGLLRVLVAELKACNCTGGSDLFAMTVRSDIVKVMQEMVPYDLILNKATEAFRERCKGLDSACKDLGQYIAKEAQASRVLVKAIVAGQWTSPYVFPSIVRSLDGVCFFPPKALKNFRQGVIARQKTVLKISMSADSVAGDLLAAWESFNKSDRMIKESVHVLYAANARLVDSIARGYRFAVDQEQLRSAASFGLLRVIYRFAPEMQFRFSSLAATWIKQMILRDLGQQNMIRLPEGSAGQIAAIKAVLLKSPNCSNAHIAEVTGLKPDVVDSLMYFIAGGPTLSIDTAFAASDAGDIGDMHDYIEDTNNDFVTEIEEDDTAAFLSRVIGEVLNDQHAMIMRARFGLGVPVKSLAEIAAEMNCSGEKVRLAQITALQRLAKSRYAEDLKALWA